MSGDIGCFAEWSWEVRTRTGELVATPQSKAWALEGERRLSDTGQATLTVATDCCETIDDVETGDELVLYRNNAVVYFGPCKKATRQSPFGQAVIQSFDRTWWLTGRFFAFPVDWTGRDVGLNLRDLLAANTAVDPLVAVQWFDPPPGYLLGTILSIIPTETTHFDLVLNSIAESVIDYTVLGDQMLVGTEGTPVPDLPVLTPDSWTDGRFTTVQDHELFATEVFVDGKNAVFARYPPAVITPPFVPVPNLRWGNRRIRVADSLLSDDQSCLTRAKAEYSVRNPPQRRLAVPDGFLIDKKVSFDALIPGARAVVQAPTTCEVVTLIDMLLATVKWTVVAGEEQGVTAALVEKGLPVA